VERKWHERYPQKFRCRAVEGMNACDNIVRLAQELGVSRTLLYKWRHRLDPGNGLISPNRVRPDIERELASPWSSPCGSKGSPQCRVRR